MMQPRGDGNWLETTLVRGRLFRHPVAMLAVLSPAKKLDWDRTTPSVKATTPVLKKDMAELLEKARQLTAKDLGKMMSLSPTLSKLNYERFQKLEAPGRKPSVNSRMAALAFDGDTYQGLRAWEFDESDLGFAQEHVRILSGLYGVLRPLDAISPYRLEMGVRIDTSRGKSLYDYWGHLIARQLTKDAKKDERPLIVNLASTEYFTAARAKDLGVPVLTCVFKEIRGGTAKVISFSAKRARGMMARYIVKQRATEPEALKDFKEANYRFDRKSSTDSDWVFSRKS
jgi:cytoplasmic iron level regulating protein YaaA (DUF328/UPF0246 family)